MQSVKPDNINYIIHKSSKKLTVKEFLENYYDFKYTSQKCKKCHMYNKRWSCPSFNNNIKDYWKKFDTVELIHLKIILDENLLNKRFTKDEIYTILDNTLFKEKNILIGKLEDNNRYFLSTGYCNICERCSKEDNIPCRFPEIKKYSIESLGGIVTKISNELFNNQIKWIDMNNGILPEYLTLVMAVLD